MSACDFSVPSVASCKTKPPVKPNLQKQQLQAGVAGGAGGGEVADERERIFVGLDAAGRGASFGREQRGPKIGDEQCGLAVAGELLKPGHDFTAGEEWRCGLQRVCRIPVVEAVAGLFTEEFPEQFCRSVGERGIVLRDGFRIGGGLLFEFRQAERNRGLDLLREIEIVAGDMREQRVDEMEASQLIAGRCGHRRIFDFGFWM